MNIIRKTQVDYTIRDIFEDRYLQKQINFFICHMMISVIAVGNIFGFIEIEPLPDKYTSFGIVCWVILVLVGFRLLIDMGAKLKGGAEK